MNIIDDKIYKIYVLKDPETDLVRYVGLTKQTIKRRYKHHFYDKNINRKTNWIKSLKNKGLKPLVEVIEDNLTQQEAITNEIKYILLYKSIGAKLTNSNNGGALGYDHKGKKKSKEHIAKIVATRLKNNSYKHSDEHKKYMSELMKGRKPKNHSSIIEKRKRKVLQYDLDGNFIQEWESFEYLKRQIPSFDIEAIRKNCQNKRESYKNYIWKYKN